MVFIDVAYSRSKFLEPLLLLIFIYFVEILYLYTDGLYQHAAPLPPPALFFKSNTI